MGQTTSVQEDKMAKRIRQNMGSFVDFGHHIKQANEWARLCPTPKTCFLAFRIVINDCISAEILPYVWRVRGNVSIEVRKIRRRATELQLPLDMDATSTIARNDALYNFSNMTSSNNSSNSTQADAIGHAKLLTVRQFYYVFCFLSDIKSCAAHTVQFPDRVTSDTANDLDFDETECQICMDKQKQVVLPCTHSFCLYCFQHWSVQSKTCPICRSKIECSEGSDLWQLTSNEVEDIGSYATDLVARIYEYLEKKERSQHSEATLQRSAALFATAVAVKPTPLTKFRRPELFPTTFPLGIASLMTAGVVHLPIELDDDVLLALEVASGEDQVAAMQHYEQVRRDHVFAMTLAMEAEADDDDGAFEDIPEEL